MLPMGIERESGNILMRESTIHIMRGGGVLSQVLEEIYKEIKLLRREVEELKEILIPEIKPSSDEVAAVEAGRAEYKKGEYSDWKDVRKRLNL